MHRPLLSLLLLALPLTACSGKQPEDAAAGQLELTHSWNVPVGKSVFVSADMGTTPQDNGDAMMKVMPGVLHRIGEACKTEAGLAGEGELVLSFNVAGGVAKALTIDPEGDASECLATALDQEGEALAGVPDGTVVVRTSYSVGAAQPAPAG